MKIFPVMKSDELKRINYEVLVMEEQKELVGRGRVARMGEKRGACRVLVGKPEYEVPLGRPRLRWEDKY